MLTIHTDASKKIDENSLGFILYQDKHRIGELLFSFKDNLDSFNIPNNVLETTTVELSRTANKLLFNNRALIFSDQDTYSKKDKDVQYAKSHHHGSSHAAKVHKLVYNARLFEIDSEHKAQNAGSVQVNQSADSVQENVNHSQDTFKVITNDLYAAIKELLSKGINYFKLPVSDIMKEIILNKSNYPISYKLLYNEKNMEKRDKALLDFIDVHDNNKEYLVNLPNFPLYTLKTGNDTKLFLALNKEMKPTLGTKKMAKANPFDFNINNVSAELNQMYGLSPKNFKTDYIQKVISLEEGLQI